MEEDALAPAVVLIEPQEEGNIGSVARAMVNMGLEELVLVRPETPIGATARAFAVGAGHVLEQARIASSLDVALAPYHRLIGTTSGRGRELPIPCITPRELPAALAGEPAGVSTAVLFGPEASGLDNEQLARCTPLVQIPSSPQQPTLNLAQAVLVVVYELYIARQSRPQSSAVRPAAASSEELEGLFAQLSPLLAEIGFVRDDTFASVLRDLRRLAARAGPTSREVSILRGICRRAQHALSRAPGDKGRHGE